jgi:SAM-dependent methyltransferase
MGWGSGLGALLLWSSPVGKFRARDAPAERGSVARDEQVLDVGCGLGLMLIGAAKRLASGRAIGIDLWQDVDQANNSAAATRRNAELEGVRADVRDGDARRTPFGGAVFDVVVSSLALHNIYDAREREQALGEIARVLKPGGHAAIFDVRHACARFYERNGFTIVKKWTTMLSAARSSRGRTRGASARVGGFHRRRTRRAPTLGFCRPPSSPGRACARDKRDHAATCSGCALFKISSRMR